MMYPYIPLIDGDGIGTTPAHVSIAPTIAPINGKILFISLGASSSATESVTLAQYIAQGKTLGEVNPDVDFVNCAIAARDVGDWSDPENPKYITGWQQTVNTLSGYGYTLNDVQVMWLKEDDLSDKESDPGRVTRLFWKYVTLLQTCKAKMPNLKRVYISGRSCVLPQAELTHEEPKPYYTGLAAKMIVQEQIAGNPYLSLDAVGWISDILYLWTNGYEPRVADGYIRTVDSWKGDGIHPNEIGNDQVATFLYNNLLELTDWFPNTFNSEKTIPEYDSTTYTPIPDNQYPDITPVVVDDVNNDGGNNLLPGLLLLLGLGTLYYRSRKQNKAQ